MAETVISELGRDSPQRCNTVSFRADLIDGYKSATGVAGPEQQSFGRVARREGVGSLLNVGCTFRSGRSPAGRPRRVGDRSVFGTVNTQLKID